MARTALDGARRRRLYLFRHGSVDYIDANGEFVPDPDVVDLNARGIRQAEAMAGLFEGVHVDRAVCSGLPRTRQTAELVLATRAIDVECNPGFEEIRPATGESAGGYDIVSDIAFSHWRAEHPEACFLGGEAYADFYERIVAAMLSTLAEDDWDNLAVFAHGGTNSAVLGWVTGIGLKGFGLIDQATCCLNIIDFDIAPDGDVLRKVVRGMNITADDPVMRHRDHGDMEALARRLISLGERR
jgi:broad specificity phosphatase PhoE